MHLNHSEFQSPSAAWRGKPFWSWNGDLDEAELARQIDVMQAMGLGGFFMHSRTGLVTEYLGDEWFRLTNACADDAERRGLEAWLYDEDRWPSGTAGGMVTENPAFRSRFLSLRPVPGADFAWGDDLVAAFTCALDGVDATGVRRIYADTAAGEIHPWTVLAFTVEESSPSSFYNGFTYVDTLNRAATDDYIARTHERYKAECGDRLGASIKGIFTDEPHRGPVMSGFSLGNENRLWMTPWTPTLFEEFERRFGYDLVDRLPDLFLIVDNRRVSPVKWAYMELTQQLFLENYAAPLYDWCEAHNLLLTGHALHEDSLTAQACMQGSLMRFYEYQHYPGVDVLTEGNRCYWIVKQLTSAARQTGRKWLLSELYGCTGWQMDLEAHKAVGDWQALFGINLRCHHLSWYTMGGEAKRDYPASMLHQSAWWREYDAVETYFARLGVLLTAGEPCCELLVINPIESVWARIHAGWAHNFSAKAPEIDALETAYRDTFHWLAGAQIDFDYGDEEMLGRMASIEHDADGMPVFRVGVVGYRTIFVPPLTTLRAKTFWLLREFVGVGGTVVFAGEPPAYLDAAPSDAAASLCEEVEEGDLCAVAVPFECAAIVEACRPSPANCVEIIDPTTGNNLPNVFCQLRREGDRWILVTLNVDPSASIERARIRVHGAGDHATVEEWDCRHGDRYALATSSLPDGGVTWETHFAPSGERAYVLTEITNKTAAVPPLLPRPTLQENRRAACPGPYAFTLDEPNVCVLDRARFRIDKGGNDGEWQEAREILKVDQAVRRAFDLPIRGGEMIQPWYRDKHAPTHKVVGKVTLEFTFGVDADAVPTGEVWLALEQAEAWRVWVNGVECSPSLEPLTPGYPLGAPLPASARPSLPVGRGGVRQEGISLQGTNSETTGTPSPYRSEGRATRGEGAGGEGLQGAGEDCYWVDTAFHLLPLPPNALRPGANTLTLEADFREDLNLEALYLLGDFGVRVFGGAAALTTLPAALEPRDLVGQGLPFYGGAITYTLPVPVSAAARAPGERASLLLPAFSAACAKAVSRSARLDAAGKLIAFPPHQADVTNLLAAGATTIELEVILTRRNTFGPLHQVPLRTGAYGPGNFITEGASWSDDYQLYPAGLLEAPQIAWFHAT